MTLEPKAAVGPVEAAQPLVSAVIAVSGNAPELGAVLARYHQEFVALGVDAEFVVVLDGVPDAVFEAARNARPAGSNVRLVRLNHPFGESIALASGFKIARGQIIVTVPSYLQVEPGDLHALLDGIDSGLDLVQGYRQPRVDSIMNRIQSALFNGVMRVLTRVRLHDLNCPVRAFRRKVLEDVSIQGDMVRFLPVMAHRHGFRVGEVTVRHLKERGKAGFFGVNVYVRRFLDIINLLFLSKFTRAPLRFFGTVGFASIVLGVVICAYLAFNYFFLDKDLRDKVSLVLGVMLVVLGVQIFSIGLVGEIIIYTQAKNLKEYRLIDEHEEHARSERAKERGRNGISSEELRADRRDRESEGGSSRKNGGGSPPPAGPRRR